MTLHQTAAQSARPVPLDGSMASLRKQLAAARQAYEAACDAEEEAAAEAARRFPPVPRLIARRGGTCAGEVLTEAEIRERERNWLFAIGPDRAREATAQALLDRAAYLAACAAVTADTGGDAGSETAADRRDALEERIIAKASRSLDSIIAKLEIFAAYLAPEEADDTRSRAVLSALADARRIAGEGGRSSSRQITKRAGASGINASPDERAAV